MQAGMHVQRPQHDLLIDLHDYQRIENVHIRHLFDAWCLFIVEPTDKGSPDDGILTNFALMLFDFKLLTGKQPSLPGRYSNANPRYED
jgi:hypothetical protein